VKEKLLCSGASGLQPGGRSQRNATFTMKMKKPIDETLLRSGPSYDLRLLSLLPWHSFQTNVKRKFEATSQAHGLT